MELSDYERFAFIRCAGYKYTESDMDLMMEKLIYGGKRNLDELNNALIAIDPVLHPNKQTMENEPHHKINKS